MKNLTGNAEIQPQFRQSYNPMQQQQYVPFSHASPNGIWDASLTPTKFPPQTQPNLISDSTDNYNYGFMKTDPSSQQMPMFYPSQEEQMKPQYPMNMGYNNNFQTNTSDPLLLLDKSLVSMIGQTQPQSQEWGKIDPKYYSPRMF